jgi:hypothetical protein
VTLDDVSTLLYLPFEDLLLDHNGSLFINDATKLKVQLICADMEEADYDVKRTNRCA